MRALTVKFGQHLIFIYKFSKSNLGKPLIWRADEVLIPYSGGTF